jgi:hypothetical protein
MQTNNGCLLLAGIEAQADIQVIFIASITLTLTLEIYRYPLRTVRASLQGCIPGLLQLTR